MTYTDTDTGEVITALPECDLNNPADVEAWYGNYSFFDHYRKCVLADCKEIERAKAVLSGEKMTVDRLDDLARKSDIYLTFLAKHLAGRRAREVNVRESFAR